MRGTRIQLIVVLGVLFGHPAVAGAMEPDDLVAQQLSVTQIRATVGWDFETGQTSPVLVAVLDSGIDLSHPDLAPNIWVNPGEICDNDVDDDSNGFVDDCHGWDFVDADNVPDDPLGRGTHIAGIIAAVGNNGQGIAGISWGATILPVRVMQGAITDLRVDPATAAAAIRYAADAGANVIHCSFVNETEDAELKAAIEYAIGKGAVIVVPAGDHSQDIDRHPVYPASWQLESMLTVAAVDQGAKLSLASNFGPTTVDLFAPGIQVYSTMPGSLAGRMSGTPMAAAHVTGAVALLKSQQPQMTNDEIARKINRTASPRSILKGAAVNPGIVDLGLLIADKADPIDAVITANDRVKVGEKMAFDGSASEGQVVEYLWKFGDPIDHFGPVVVRSWNRPGRIGVELQIRTADGRTATALHHVEIYRKGLIACSLGEPDGPAPPGWLALLFLLPAALVWRVRCRALATGTVVEAGSWPTDPRVPPRPSRSAIRAGETGGTRWFSSSTPSSR